MAVTKLTNLIDPEVMAFMIGGKITDKIVVSPFAKFDFSLAGRPGDTITLPKYNYIGDAVDVAEGATATASTLTTSSAEYTVKKAMSAVTLTDEAMESGYGNPAAEAASQIAKAIASKQDADAMAALLTSTNTYAGGAAIISYDAIVSAIDIFNEEFNSMKAIFINPKQVTQLRKDPNFISADKYGLGTNVMMTGEIGRIANCVVVPSRRIVLDTGTYKCPIVELETADETQDETAALTIFMKRETNVETERHTLSRTTDISADKIYVASLTNEGKVVVATFKSA